ncbi:MAG: hypothetical protein JO222_13675, partial [Frankiales bacterium]|nr:hypothetical protein [Frankiales bacterium]
MAPIPLAVAAARADHRRHPAAVVAAALVAVAIVAGLVPLAVPAGASTGTSRA